MKTLSAREIIQRSKAWPPLVEAADRALEALATGAVEAPVRSSLPLPDGQLLTMPGRLHGMDQAIVKLVTVVPGNPARNRPMIQGIAVVFDAHAGEATAMLDGAALTAVRTGAISAAAARRLADPKTSTMALLGAGGQALWQVRALASVLPIERVAVWSPTAARRERLAAQLARELRIEVHAVEEAADATRDAGLVCCSTTAQKAFLHIRMLSRGHVLVVAIGAFRPDMAEVGVSVFRKAGRVYVDDVEAVLHEGGDVIAALKEGAITRDKVLPVGGAREATAEGVTIFKSVGSAAEDAAVARALLT
jgi:ornithine cyclodeaminase